MKDQTSALLVGVLMTVFAVLGLFLWARAADPGMAVFGCSLLVFGVQEPDHARGDAAKFVDDVTRANSEFYFVQTRTAEQRIQRNDLRPAAF